MREKYNLLLIINVMSTKIQVIHNFKKLVVNWQNSTRLKILENKVQKLILLNTQTINAIAIYITSFKSGVLSVALKIIVAFPKSQVYCNVTFTISLFFLYWERTVTTKIFLTGKNIQEFLGSLLFNLTLTI